jgi:hypothetical protein
MAKRKRIDPDLVTTNIRQSVEESKTRSRRVLCKTLFTEYGFHNRNPERAARIETFFRAYGLTWEPSVGDAQRDDWIRLGLNEDRPVISERAPEPRPDDGWFSSLMHAEFESEREVELRFVAPLFESLGYRELNEAVGVPVRIWEGVSPKSREADFIYFDSQDHSLETGNALVLIECKATGQDVSEGIGQARSYVPWVKPAYYVVTNGDRIVAYLYQGGPVRDSKVLDFDRSQLATRFSDLYKVLNIDAAREAKQQNILKFGAEHPV